VAQCNVGKRGWMAEIGGCPNVGGICIGMPSKQSACSNGTFPPAICNPPAHAKKRSDKFSFAILASAGRISQKS
jgi:hypothetical protein